MDDETDYRHYPAWFPYMIFAAGTVIAITLVLT